MFEWNHDTLCVKAQQLIDKNIISSSNLKYHKRAGAIKVVKRGCRFQPCLVDFETIPDQFKNKIVETFGDPYSSVKHVVFTDYLKTDYKAKNYYATYKTKTGEALPEKNIKEYTTNASIFLTISIILDSKIAQKRALGNNKTQVWHKLAKIVKDLDAVDWPHTLPKNFKRLKQRYAKYQQQGYESLIHGNFCNKNSEKINDDAKMWLVQRWADPVNKIANTEQLFAEYNGMADQEGWKKLKAADTIYNYLHQEDIKPLWWGHRYGEIRAKEKYTMHISTRLPTMRDSLWYSDGTKLNYYYLNEDGKMQTCQVYEVIDAYSEVLLGYHISGSEDFEAQYNAYKMAAQTAGHRPYQIGFDGQGGHNKLKNGQFLTKLARLSIKTQPYNGKSKTIENAFSRLQQQFLKRDWFFTGQNIQAKRQESKANMEFILANKNELPTLDEIKETYAKRRKEWNQAPHPKSGKTRINTYLESNNAETPELTMLDMVDLFWILREKPVTYNPGGLSFTHKNQKYEYIVFDENRDINMDFHRKSIDKKFHIKYDPSDMSLIYLYEDTPLGLRYVNTAETKPTVARNRQEITEFEETFHANILQKNKDMRVAMQSETDELLEIYGAAPHQNGFKTPNVKGVNSSNKQKNKASKPKKKRSGGDSYELAEYQKDVSNADSKLEDLM